MVKKATNNFADACADAKADDFSDQATAEEMCCKFRNLNMGEDWDGAWRDCPNWAQYATTNCLSGPLSCTRDPTDDEGMAMCTELATHSDCMANALAKQYVSPGCMAAVAATFTFPVGSCGANSWGSHSDGKSKCPNQEAWDENVDQTELSKDGDTADLCCK